MLSPRLIPLVLLAYIPEAQAQSYERLQIEGTTACRTSRTFSYAVSTSGGHPTAAERAAIEAAVNTWRQAASTCSDLVFEQTADVPETNPPPADGSTRITLRTVNCVDVVPSGDSCWVADNCAEKYNCWQHIRLNIVNAGVSMRMTTGEIIGSHIELNASNGYLTTIDSPPCPSGVVGSDCVVGDVQNLVTRSIGEALGLALLSRTDSTMSSRMDWGETRKRTIDPGTLQGLCELYSRGKPTPGCEHLSTPETPEEPEPSKRGCSTTSSAPLLGALLLLLGVRRRRAGA